MLYIQGAEPAHSNCISWLGTLQLLVVNAELQEEEFGLSKCVSGTGGGLFVNLYNFCIRRFIRAVWNGNLISVH